MKKTGFMKISMIILAILTALFILLCFIQLLGRHEKLDFAKWGLVILLAAFFLLQFICLFLETPNFKKIGFYILHIGLLAFLLGNFMYLTKGASIPAEIPIDNQSYSKIQREDQSWVNLGFSINIKEFFEEYYPHSQITKWEEARVIVNHNGTTEHKILAVNHTLRINGWKIYLMSHSVARNTVLVVFKKDPGEFVSTTGLIMIMAGTFMLCLLKGRRKAGETNA